MKNLNFELFSRNGWVIPSHIYVKKEDDYYSGEVFSKEQKTPEMKKLKNEGLKLKVNFFSEDSYIHRAGTTDYIICSGIILNDEYRVRLDVVNLFKIIQLFGMNGEYLNGTYKLVSSESSFSGFELLPEGSKEEQEKSRISSIYWDNSIKFTKNMLPGHLYVGKSKNLFLCMESDLKCHVDDLYTLSYWSGSYMLYNYTNKTRKMKFLAPVDKVLISLINEENPKTIQDLVKRKFYKFQVYGDRFSGKDLGKVLDDDGSKLLDYIDQVNTDRELLWLIDGALDHSKKQLEKLKKHINNDRSTIIRYRDINKELDGFLNAYGL